MHTLVGGAVAGMVSVCATYPLDLVRARLTVQDSIIARQYNGIQHAFVTITKKEGIMALYRGINPTLLGIAPYVGLNFMVFETLKKKAPRNEEGRPDIIYLFGCGATAGACGQTAAYPFDLLRRRCQLQSCSGNTTTQYKGTLDGFQRILQHEGFFGLYKGLWPNFIKVVPSVAVMFVSNELIKRMIL